MNANQQVKATIKAHGLKVGDRFNFHGLGSDPLPTVEPTRVELGKVGNRYMLTTVTGDVTTWEFGTSAQIWADTSVEHAVTTATRTLDNGDTVYTAQCEHGWMTGFHTSADDATAVALGHGEVSRDLYVAPVAQANGVGVGDCVEFYLGDVLGADSNAVGRTQGVVTSIDVYGTLSVLTADETTVRISASATVVLETAQAELISIATDTVECLCDEIFAQRRAGKVLPEGGLVCPGDGSIFVAEGTEASDEVIAESGDAITRAKSRELTAGLVFDPMEPFTWLLDNLPAGWAWVESAESDGEYHLFTPEGVDHTVALSELRQAQAAQRLADANAFFADLAGRVLVNNGATERAEAVIMHVQDNVVWLDEPQGRSRSYPIVGVWERIVRGDLMLLDASDVAEGIAQAWAEAGSPRDAAGLPSLPIRVPGRALAQALSVPMSEDTWARLEAEIWAGTDQVERMRYPRKMKKAARRAVGYRPDRLAAKRARFGQVR